MFIIIPKCPKCKIEGEYFDAEDKKKKTWFSICMCPDCKEILESGWRGSLIESDKNEQKNIY